MSLHSVMNIKHARSVHDLRSHLTPYAKQNGGKYNFIVEPEIALPQDQVILFFIPYAHHQWFWLSI